MTSELTITPTGAQIAEQVIIKGDLAKLSEAERMAYYSELCRSLGLNPLTRPFEYIVLNGKLTLYPTRGAGDQLRSIRGITITSLTPSQVGDLFVVVATGRDRAGREDSSTGAVSIKGLTGEALANAMMKAETKAKRRLTLSLAGLGWPDESEVLDIPSAEPPAPRLTLAERAAAKAASVVPAASAEPLDADGVLPIDNGLTAGEFKALVAQVGISNARIVEVGHQLFPGIAKFADLNDAQRGQLWDALAGDLEVKPAAAAVPPEEDFSTLPGFEA